MSYKDEACERLRAYIIKRRIELRLSQPQMAKIGGFPRTSLGTFESGRNTMPKRETLEKFAVGLGVPYSVLEAVISGDDGPAPECMSLAERIISLPDSDRLAIEALITRFEQTRA